MADLDLARRAVACKGWRWMAGMRAAVNGKPGRLYTAPAGLSWEGEPRGYSAVWPSFGDCLPDLDDPATIGCLLALVREALGDPRAHVAPLLAGGWVVWSITPEHGFRVVADGPTEAAALVAALESAP